MVTASVSPCATSRAFKGLRRTATCKIVRLTRQSLYSLVALQCCLHALWAEGRRFPVPDHGLFQLDQNALDNVLSSLHRRACDNCYQGYSLTLMLSRSLTPSATVLALLPLVLSPRELMPLLVGGPLCVCQAKQDPLSIMVI